MPAHSLGPDVVGTRVVVRRVLPGQTGPTGGPAFTDVLGVCRSWQGGVCVIERDDGERITIPLELIVSGKPVPPRPAPRLRVSVRDAELHTAALVGVETTPVGEWQLRYEPTPVGRVRNRFNSCLGIGDPGVTLAAAAEQVRDFYRARDRPPRIQVELGSPTEDALRALGWQSVPDRDSHFLLASLARVRRVLGPGPSPEGALPADVTADGPRVTVTITADGDVGGDVGGDVVARGEAGVDHDWLGIHNLAVEPAYRRRGLAGAALREALAWGAEQGATTAWLHVQTDNDPALALYDRLGFAIHHSCRYLEAPPPA
ncbi:GNAT family N-acetyltransferase [Nocardioides sp. AN3]